MRNHLTKFKAIDFISHIYHNLITTSFQQTLQQLSDRSSTNSSTIKWQIFNNTSYHKLSQYHSRVRRLFITYFHNNFKNTFQQLSTHLQHIFIMRQQIRQQFITNSHNNFINKLSQQVSTRWMSIDFLLQLIQQHSFTFISTNHDTILYLLQQHTSTFLHHIFNKQTETHLQQTLTKHSSQHSSQHSTNSYKAFFTTNWWYIISTNISTNSYKACDRHFNKHSTTNFMMRIIHFNKCIRKSWYNVRHMLYNLFTTLLQLHRILHHIFITTTSSHLHHIFNEYFITTILI